MQYIASWSPLSTSEKRQTLDSSTKRPNFLKQLKSDALIPMLSPPSTERNRRMLKDKSNPKQTDDAVTPDTPEGEQILEVMTASIHPNEQSEDESPFTTPIKPSDNHYATYAEVAAPSSPTLPCSPSPVSELPPTLIKRHSTVHFSDETQSLEAEISKPGPPVLASTKPKSPSLKPFKPTYMPPDDPFQSLPSLSDLQTSLTAIHALTNRTATSLQSLGSTTASHAALLSAILSALRSTSAQMAELRAGQERLAVSYEELRQTIATASVAPSDVSWQGSTMGSIGAPGGGSVISADVLCEHDVRRPPRKVGRKIVGYVYEKDVDIRRKRTG